MRLFPTSVSTRLARRSRLLALAVCAALSGEAFAFPPAPPFTIHGIARDSYGWALKAADEGVVVIKRNGTVIAEAAINESPRVGENFRLQLPMDVNPADAYLPTAQAPGVLFTIEVRFPSTTMLVSSLTASQRTVGQPGDNLFLDFTVGLDTDGDRIPDAWEWWQLSEMGNDPSWSLATLGNGDFDGDGASDYLEYLAGTFAFLGTDVMKMNIDGIEADGSARLRAFVVVEKNYRVECTTDLVNWVTASVRVESTTAALQTNIEAADTREITLYSPVTGPPGNRFYRLRLIR
jgi:hypothetical protein